MNSDLTARLLITINNEVGKKNYHLAIRVIYTYTRNHSKCSIQSILNGHGYITLQNAEL